MQFTAFDDRLNLAEWLADHVAAVLSQAVAKNGKASIAVSGGSTPKQFFRVLSGKDIDWENVTVALVDERWVSPSSERSNQRMVTLELLQEKAAHAALLPLYRNNIEADEIEQISNEIAAIMPFDVVVLGMGLDGHTASFFPGGNNLAKATNAKSDILVIDMQADGAGEPRVTLTLPALLSASNLLLHIEGADKKIVLEHALEEADPASMPIRFILQAKPDLRVVWAP